MSRLAELEKASVEMLKEAHRRTNGNAVIAYSGGKDSIVAALLAKQAGFQMAMCEISWYFERQTANAKENAKRIGLRCEWTDSMPISWLRAHPEAIFPSCSQLAVKSYVVRQWNTYKRICAERGYRGMIYGRRRQENMVPSAMYYKKSEPTVLQIFPIREWSHDEVWEWLKLQGFPTPWIYSTPFAITDCNAPFYLLRRGLNGGVARCWEIVSEMDPRFTEEKLDLHPLSDEAMAAITPANYKQKITHSSGVIAAANKH